MPNFCDYNRISGVSDQRRLPRVGKIRLGVKLKSAKGKEYPSEVSYFVVRPEDYERRPDILESFRKRYGEKPTELDIMFPVPDELTFFPQAYKKYGGGVIRCKGDGVTYTRIDKETGEVTEGDCLHPEGCDFALDDKRRTVCKRVASLIFLIPEVTWGGVFQIDTTSFHSIIDINSAIDYCRQLAGRIHMIPLKLRREARETQYGGKKATHYTMTLALPDSSQEIRKRLGMAQAVRGMFDMFQPAAVPQIQGAGDDVPEDLYPKDTVRKPRAAPPPQAEDPIDEPDTRPAPATPPPAEPGVTPPDACYDCAKILGPRAKRFPIDDGDDLVVCLACQRKREKEEGQQQAEEHQDPSGIATEARRQREARAAEPAAATTEVQQDLLEDFGF